MKMLQIAQPCSSNNNTLQAKQHWENKGKLRKMYELQNYHTIHRNSVNNIERNGFE
jgi:hypothetical protein